MEKALYIAYLTGSGGQSIGLFYVGGGVIAGIDVGAMQYDGSYSTTQDGSLAGTLNYVVPAGANLITGPSAPTPMKVPLELRLPAGFADGRVVSINTPLGPVNAKFEKLKDLP